MKGFKQEMKGIIEKGSVNLKMNTEFINDADLLKFQINMTVYTP